MAELNLEEIKSRAAHYAATPNHPGAYFTTRDSADDVPALVAEVEGLRAAEQRVRDHHWLVQGGTDEGCCNEDEETWPCKTIRALNGGAS